MADINKIEESAEKLRRKAGAESARLYNGNFIQRECEIVWDALACVQVNGKTDTMVLAELLDLHAAAKYLKRLQSKILSDEMSVDNK